MFWVVTGTTSVNETVVSAEPGARGHQQAGGDECLRHRLQAGRSLGIGQDKLADRRPPPRRILLGEAGIDQAEEQGAGQLFLGQSGGLPVAPEQGREGYRLDCSLHPVRLFPRRVVGAACGHRTVAVIIAGWVGPLPSANRGGHGGGDQQHGPGRRLGYIRPTSGRRYG